MVLLPFGLIGGVFRVDWSDPFADEDVGERGLIIFILEGTLLGGNNFLVDFPQNTGAIHVEIERVLNLGQHGFGIASFFTLKKDSLVNYKFVHF